MLHPQNNHGNTATSFSTDTATLTPPGMTLGVKTVAQWDQDTCPTSSVLRSTIGTNLYHRKGA